MDRTTFANKSAPGTGPGPPATTPGRSRRAQQIGILLDAGRLPPSAPLVGSRLRCGAPEESRPADDPGTVDHTPHILPSILLGDLALVHQHERVGGRTFPPLRG